MHITAAGADSAGKQELGLDLVERAALLVCDLVAQSKERGEFQHFFAQSECARVLLYVLTRHTHEALCAHC